MHQINEASGSSKTTALNHGSLAVATTPVVKQLLSKRELAAVLGVSQRTIENWLLEKRIPRLRLSARLTRFNLPKVLNALARYEVKEVGARR